MRWSGFKTSRHQDHAQIGWSSYVAYKFVFEHRSMMHQWKLRPKNFLLNWLRFKNPRISWRLRNNLRFKEPRCMTSKIDKPTMAQEVEESTKIDEQSKFQDLNAWKLYLRFEKFLEKESLNDDIKSKPIYEEKTFTYVGPIVKEKCMHIGVKISLSYWLMGRSPLMEFPFMNLEDKIHLEGEGNVMPQISMHQRYMGGGVACDGVLEYRIEWIC